MRTVALSIKSAKEVFAFFDIVGIAFARGIGGFFLLFVIGPAAIILLGYLIYIVVMTIKELRK